MRTVCPRLFCPGLENPRSKVPYYTRVSTFSFVPTYVLPHPQDPRPTHFAFAKFLSGLVFLDLINK
jgi:hypothetical protein